MIFRYLSLPPPTKLLLPGTRNKGIELAKGEWIFFIDDDDEATPNFIKWLNSSKQKKKYDFYRFPNIERLNGKNKMYIFKWWHKDYSPQFSTYLFKKSFIISNKLKLNENISYGEDIYFQMILNSVKNKKVKYIHHFSIFHNSFSNTETMMNSKKHDPNEHLKFVYDALSSNYVNRKSYCLTFLGIYYQSMLRKDKYIDKNKALIEFWNAYLKINPKFTDFWKVNLPWKIQLFKFKRQTKKINYI